MKQLFIFLITLSFSLNSTAQIRLDVEGDAKVTGRLILDDNNSNMFIGIDAGLTNTTGTDNIFLGRNSGKGNTTGVSNTFVGTLSGAGNTTGNDNTFVGAFSGSWNTTGRNNTFLGTATGSWNTTGYSNTFLGPFSGSSNTTGYNNIFLGTASGSSNTTGYNNTYIGFSADGSADSLVNSIAIGYNAIVTGDNKVRIGNDNILEIGGQVNWSTLSDGRYKKNISTNKNGLAFILALTPVQYNYDGVKMFKEKRAKLLKAHQKAIERSAKNNSAQGINIPIPPLPNFSYMEKMARENSKIVYTGFLAQEVEKAIENTGYTFSGIVKPENEQQKYALRYAEFVVPLVDAVQQQQKIIEALKIENQALSKRLDEVQQQQKIKEELKTENEAVKAVNEALSERLSELENIVATLVTNNKPSSTQFKKLHAAKLEQNLPNPFGKITKLPYYIPQDSRTAQIKIYNLSGQLLDTININQFGKGEVILEIDGFSSGQYHYSLEVDGRVIDTKKMNLQK